MSLEHMLRDEQESWWLLLEEAEREGEFEMSIRDVNSIQDQALAAFERVPQSEAAAWAQVIAQCEIAQQLADLSERQEKQNELLQRIAVGIECLESTR